MGLGAQLISERWDFFLGGGGGKLLPAGFQPAAKAVSVSMGVKARQPLGTVGCGFAWAKPRCSRQSQGGEPAPRLSDAQDFGGPHFSQRGVLHPFQPAFKKRGQGQDVNLAGVVRAPGGLHWERVGARGVSGAPVPPAGPSSRSHGDTHHSTSSESYLRSWRISLIASMVLISLRERMETINKAHMEHIIWAASPSPCCL